MIQLYNSLSSKTLRIWDVDRPNRKIRPQECDLGQLKRDVRCILIDSTDEFLYAGTTSGDILQVQLQSFVTSFHLISSEIERINV